MGAGEGVARPSIWCDLVRMEPRRHGPRASSNFCQWDGARDRRQHGDRSGNLRGARRSREILRLEPRRQGLTLVHFSAQRKRFLWDTPGVVS